MRPPLGIYHTESRMLERIIPKDLYNYDHEVVLLRVVRNDSPSHRCDDVQGIPCRLMRVNPLSQKAN